ncbi:MAG: helix-turn-helix transcriptional regulator [Gammaproteobacteria bacterium]|nr:MAG: helix-turn-helix transcriptional regulator [Gammaproteobacteria bacterium]
MPPFILSTKLHAPPHRSEWLRRSRLLDQLDAGLSRKFTLVSAPAGFGKTTLVVDWLRGRQQRFAWLSLDEADSDVNQFLSYLLAALASLEAPGVGAASVALDTAQPPPPAHVLTILLNALSALEERIVLVLDDYHRLDSEAVDQALDFLVERAPSSLHLVVTTREDPSLPLARMRARGEMVELRLNELRFSTSESADFLNQLMGLALSDGEVAALEQRTEGWIAGLQMAALSLHGCDDKAAFIESFTGSHRFVLDYLLEEVLRRQPEAVRDFLQKTAVLDRFSASLCNAVTGHSGLEGREEGNAEEMLLALEQQNLFLVPLDEARQWYRYHHLFGDVLRARMRKDKPALQTVHQRASAWFENNGFPVDAIHHALTANDSENAARLVEQAWPALRRSKPERIFLDWIAALPPSRIKASPVLSFHRGFCLLSQDLTAADSPLSKAQAWVDMACDEAGRAKAERAGMVICNEDEFAQLPGLLGIARAYQCGAYGDLPGIVRNARCAMEHFPAGDTLWRGAATALLGLAQWSSGDLEGAYDAIAESAETMRKSGDLVSCLGALCLLSGIRGSQGRFRDAGIICQKALKIAEAFGDHPPQGTADIHVELAELAYERGDLVGAEQHLQTSQAMEDYTRLPEVQHRWFIVMARVKQAQGNFDAAEALLDEGAQCQIMSPAPETQPISAWMARLWLARGRIDKVQHWADKSGLTPEDETGYLLEFQHLTLARLLIAKYRDKPDEHEAQRILGLLTRLAVSAETGKRQRSVAQAHMLSALLHDTIGDAQTARNALQQALDIAEPENYVRLFADEGEPMLALLRRERRQMESPALVDQILSGLLDSNEPTATGDGNHSSEALLEPLSERELQVLRLLASELTGPQIAEHLFVSLNTLRTHTKNIYSKLGVNNRRAAVCRAAELSLT